MGSEGGANYMEISEGVRGKSERVKGEVRRRVGKRLERGKGLSVKGWWKRGRGVAAFRLERKMC